MVCNNSTVVQLYLKHTAFQFLTSLNDFQSLTNWSLPFWCLNTQKQIQRDSVWLSTWLPCLLLILATSSKMQPCQIYILFISINLVYTNRFFFCSFKRKKFVISPSFHLYAFSCFFRFDCPVSPDFMKILSLGAWSCLHRLLFEKQTYMMEFTKFAAELELNGDKSYSVHWQLSTIHF